MQAQRGGQVPHVHRRPGQGGKSAVVAVGEAAQGGRLAGHAGPRDGAPREGEENWAQLSGLMLQYSRLALVSDYVLTGSGLDGLGVFGEGGERKLLGSGATFEN